MRAFWTGDIVFGLVQIPVKIYSATKDLSPTFHQLHKTCGARVNMVRRCSSCNLDLDWNDMGKGYDGATLRRNVQSTLQTWTG